MLKTSAKTTREATIPVVKAMDVELLPLSSVGGMVGGVPVEGRFVLSTVTVVSLIFGLQLFRSRVVLTHLAIPSDCVLEVPLSTSAWRETL